MPLREDRAPVWAIWLLIAFGAVQPFIWTMTDDAFRRPVVFFLLLVVWVTLLILAALATRRIGWLWQSLFQQQQAHRATLTEIAQLQTQNAMLETITRSVDVPLAFQELASRIARLVPCDRVGLALLSEDGNEFQTYTARVQEDERRASARPEVVFKVERTMIGDVVRSREPLVIADMHDAAPDHLDANVVVSAGFRSGLVIPLVANHRAVGTLNLVARKPNAFTRQDIDPLQAIAEILAVSWVAQQLQMTIGRYRTMEVMSELTLGIAADINSALQTIVGQCDIILRTNNEPAVKRDMSTIVQQAQRISTLLERMRATAHERLREAADSMSQKGGMDGREKIEPF